jgi:hypothetical protein
MDADAESSPQRIEPAAPAPTEGEHLDGSRARRSRNRGVIVTLVVSFLLLLVPAAVLRVVSGDGNDGEDGAYRAYGVLFHYPPGWSRWAGSVDEGSSEVLEWAVADALWSTLFGPDSGPEVGGFVSVSAYRLDTPATAQSMDADLPKLVSTVQQNAEQAGFVVQGSPEQLTMAGLPAVRFRVTGTVEGTPFQSTNVFAFDGTTGYVVNCVQTAEAKEIQRGCDQIIRTFSVD